MKQHKWHKEIKAWADGAEIQYRKIGSNKWHHCELNDFPYWDNFIFEYRIKPKPIPDVIKYLNMIVNNYGTRVYITDTIDDNPLWEICIKLTLDGVTYEPKSVEFELIEKGK